MRVVIAVMKHETNTFSPVPTPIERFARSGSRVLEGRAAYEAYKGTGSGLGAFIDLAEGEGAELEIPVCAEAWPSGPVDDTALWSYVRQAEAKGDSDTVHHRSGHDQPAAPSGAATDRKRSTRS